MVFGGVIWAGGGDGGWREGCSGGFGRVCRYVMARSGRGFWIGWCGERRWRKGGRDHEKGDDVATTAGVNASGIVDYLSVVGVIADVCFCRRKCSDDGRLTR